MLLGLRYSISSGLVLALACSVKIIPLIFLPAFLLYSFRASFFKKFLCGFGLGFVGLFALPFIWLGAEAVQNIFLYSSFRSFWGIPGFLMLAEVNSDAAVFDRLSTLYVPIGKLLIIAGILLQCTIMRTSSLLAICAASYAVFAVFAPGFAVQYLTLGVALLCAVKPLSSGISLGILGGAMAIASYSHFLVSIHPLTSNHTGSDPKLVVFFSFLCWIVLAQYLFTAIQKALSQGSEPA
jgi:hypothetical protein